MEAVILGITMVELISLVKLQLGFLFLTHYLHGCLLQLLAFSVQKDLTYSWGRGIQKVYVTVISQVWLHLRTTLKLREKLQGTSSPKILAH